MTVKELIDNTIDIIDVEVYRWKGKKHIIHGDYIEPVEDVNNAEVDKFEIMTETEYNNTILLNSCMCANFQEWYGDKRAKVLIIIIKGGINICIV